jgi:ribosomal protein S27AE
VAKNRIETHTHIDGCAEERKKLEKERKRQIAWREYELEERSLLPFTTGKKPCPKCGGAFRIRHHIDAQTPTDCPKYYSLLGYTKETTDNFYFRAEHIHWSCADCSHTIKTRTLDRETTNGKA